MNIQGKTALVTGASRGIGRAIALELAQQGIQRLVLVARNPQRLATVAAEVEALGVEAHVLSLDLAQAVDVNTAIAQTWRDIGPIQLLVNCAGVAHQTPFLQTQTPQVQAELSTNVMGLYAITRPIARRMVARGEGSIVNVSSLMGKVAAPTMATYSATKFAIVGFTQALRSELACHNVRVIALLPTLTKTDMVENFDWFKWVAPVMPETVARSLICGLDRGSSEIVVGWQSHAAVWLNRLLPGWVEFGVRMAAPLSRRGSLREWLDSSRSPV